MRKSQRKLFSAVSAVIIVMFFASMAYAQGSLDGIIIYKGETAGTGPGITSCKLTVGEEIVVTAKGVDVEGKEVPIWPTWKADKELSITVKEGRSKTAIVKALKEGIAGFEAIYITDEGKKVTGGMMCEIKAAK